jgi:hypothetical protein
LTKTQQERRRRQHGYRQHQRFADSLQLAQHPIQPPCPCCCNSFVGKKSQKWAVVKKINPIMK